MRPMILRREQTLGKRCNARKAYGVRLSQLERQIGAAAGTRRSANSHCRQMCRVACAAGGSEVKGRGGGGGRARARRGPIRLTNISHLLSSFSLKVRQFQGYIRPLSLHPCYSAHCLARNFYLRRGTSTQIYKSILSSSSSWEQKAFPAV